MPSIHHPPRALIAAVLLSLATAASAQESAAILPGLVATATDGQRTVTFVAPRPNFTLTGRQSIHPQLGPEFKVEWNGLLRVFRGGEYTLTGAPQILLNGAEVQDRKLAVEAGDHTLVVKFARSSGGPARVQLQWEADFFRREPVPFQALGHRVTPPDATASAASESGRLLFEEFNCASCHKSTGLQHHSRVGPDLSAIGTRTTASWMFHWLENPRRLRSTAVMPSILRSEQERADVAAYLATLVDPKGPPKETPADATRAARGKELYRAVGCGACHGDAETSLAGIGSKTTAAKLALYLRDPLAVDPSGRMPNSLLSRDEAASIAEHLVQSRDPRVEAPPPAGDVERGKALVASAGCANCHTINTPSGRIVSTVRAPDLDRLNVERGCLSQTPPASVPDFHLSDTERLQVAAYVKRPDASEAPIQDFKRLTSKFQCNTCHELHGPALVTFEQPPPPLTPAGEKLRRSWLENVLGNRKRVRPWMALRMPDFGADNTRPLIDHFAAQAGAEPGEGGTIARPAPDVVQAGVKLIGRGEGGLSCINCHDFRGEKSGGEMRGPDMTEMYDRIRVDWLHRWLREPSRIIPGTAMPAFFSETPEPQAARMIDQLTAALSAGKAMPIPEGLSEQAQAYLLLVKNEPIVFRTFIQDSSPRSIAVGLPGLQNYCFDAELCRLRFAWTGDFLDVKAAWADRGGQQARILGQKWLVAPNEFPIRIGSADEAPTVQFKGYRLVNKIPEFMYEVNGVLVRERIGSAQGAAGLVRSFTIDSSDRDAWFVSPEIPGVEITSSGGALTNGRLRFAAGKDLRFDVRMSPK